MKPAEWLLIPALIAPVAMSAPAYATQYLSVAEAQQLLFPHASFEQAYVALTPAIKRQIEQTSGVRVRHALQTAWRVEAAGKTIGWFVLDEVIGKHELITYAVAIDANGALSGVEILNYRESHGGEVRNPKWRAQFMGKRAGDAIRLDEDIKNISGATLSCKNLTNGVRRVLATYQAALK